MKKLFLAIVLLSALTIYADDRQGGDETINSISTDSIVEKTTDHGVDIESINLKDTNLTSTGNIAVTTTTGMNVTNTTGTTITINRSGSVGSASWQADGTDTGMIQAISGGGLGFYRGASPTLTMSYDSAGNVGIGVTPSAINTAVRGVQIGNSILSCYNAQTDGAWTDLTTNAYHSSNGYDKYIISSEEACKYQQVNGTHTFYVAGTGTADNDISWSTGLQVNANGDATVGRYLKVPNMPSSSGYSDVQIDPADGTFYYVSSSRDLKENIVDMTTDDSSFIYSLKTKKYDRKNGSRVGELGLIAEEVENIRPDLACKDKDGKTVAYSRSELIIPILDQVQRHHKIVESQQEIIQSQQAEIDMLKTQLADVIKRLETIEKK